MLTALPIRRLHQCLVSVKDNCQAKICLFEHLYLTFQNKLTVGCPDTIFKFLQTSGASEGAEINQRKALGSQYAHTIIHSTFL